MRRLMVLALIVLLNYPVVRDAWRQHEIDSSGREVVAIVVKTQVIGGGHFVSYRLPDDPSGHVYAAILSSTAFAAAQSGHLTARVVPGKPDLNAVAGQVPGRLFLVIAVVGDVLVAVFAVAAWRRRRRWTRRLVTAVEGDFVTFTMGDLELTARGQGTIGQILKGDLRFNPETDVVPSGPSAAITHLGGSRYRLIAPVRTAGSTYTELILHAGYVVRIRSDEIAHAARPKELGEVTGEFVVTPT